MLNVRFFFHLSLTIILMISFLTSCKRVKSIESEVPVKQEVAFKIETSSDTIFVDETSKNFAFLVKPYFENSGMMVYLSKDDGQVLKKDLSNEYDVSMDIFLNLRHDTVNQKWMKGNNLDKTVVFGKQFSSKGNKTVRGYILEYQDSSSPIDSVFENKNVKKYYFEKEIFVVSRENTAQ